MGNRAEDWLSQGLHDLDHAQRALDGGDFDWACFAAHQGAEKAVKGLFLSLGGEGWGHSITALLNDLAKRAQIPEELFDSARRLDKHYIPTRYPNGFDSGAPHSYYTVEEAAKALRDGRSIYDFCEQSVCKQ